MRILALMTEAYGALGGIQQFNRDWLEAQSQADASLSIDVLTRAEYEPYTTASNIRQRCPRFGKLGYALCALRCSRLLGPDDLIFCGHINLLPVASLAARLSGARLWLQTHGIEAWDRPGRLIRRLARNVSMITAVSRYTRQKILQWCALPPERLKLLPDTVMRRFQPGEVDAEFLDRYGLADRTLVLTVGRLSADEAYKGHDTVIDALPQLTAQVADICYAVIGDGDDLPRLKQRVIDNGVEDAVRFCGRISDRDLVSFYRAADLFVMLSSGEGFGIVYLEALSCGTPVLGLNTRGARDVLVHSGDDAALEADDDLPQKVIANLRRPPDTQRATTVFSHANFDAHVTKLTAWVVQG